MEKIKSVCVFCGASTPKNPLYEQAAQELGTLLGKNDIRVVYGGGKIGLMGIIANSAIAAGGKVTGYMTEFLNEYEGGHTDITEFHLVESMHERKHGMFESSDACLILPGGLGTLEEAFEVMTWKQVGLHNKFIGILDINNYWSPLFNTFIDHMIEENFVRTQDKKLYTMISNVSDVIDVLSNASQEKHDFVAKWG